jgi:hypothetical protein
MRMSNMRKRNERLPLWLPGLRRDEDVVFSHERVMLYFVISVTGSWVWRVYERIWCFDWFLYRVWSDTFTIGS